MLDVTAPPPHDDDRVVDDETIASTRPNSDSVLIEEPSIGKEDERADERHGHGEQPDQRRAPALKEEEHDIITSTIASKRVWYLSMPSVTGRVVSSATT